MNTKIIKQNVYAALVVGATITIGACSSNPSPWSQQASPWDSRQAAADDQNQMEPVASVEPIEPIEPVGMAAMESVAVEADSEYPAEPGEMAAAEPMPEPEPEPVMEAEPMPVAAGGSIMSQPANHYAVQVVASSSMGGLQAFAKQHQLSDQWTAETSVNGKTWFVLLLGVYPTMTEANEALATVQGQLDTSPWVRSVGSLQAVSMQ